MLIRVECPRPECRQGRDAYTEPLPPDLALRLRGARELPGFGLRMR